MRDERHRIWPAVLRYVAKHKAVTAREVAEEILDYPEEEDDKAHRAACQILRRMRMWGYVRPAGHADPTGSPQGRRPMLFEITERGRQKLGRKKQ